MNLYLIRHGQTNYNVKGLVTSRPGKHVYLTDQGIAQAKQAAEKLKDTPIDLIFTSELYRTHQTAEYINKYHDAPIKSDPRLNDIRTGFEDGSCLEYDSEKAASSDPFTFRHGDGESSEDVLARVKTFLADLKKEPYENIAIVGSEHPLALLLGLIDNIDPRIAAQGDINNGEIITRTIA